MDPAQITGEASNKALIFSHWDAWDVREYLETYFHELGQDSYENLLFLVRELGKFSNKPKMRILDFGSGPTVFAGLAAAPFASEIHLSDYLPSNLEEIKKWLTNDKSAFNWNACTEKLLELEGNINVTHKEILEREALLRKKVTQVFRSDASLEWPIFAEKIQKYPIVISNFCADSATSSREVWQAYTKNMLNLVENGGQVLISALRNCKYYKSGNQFFPSANVNENDLSDILKKEKFILKETRVEIKHVPACEKDGFTTIMLATAKKSG